MMPANPPLQETYMLNQNSFASLLLALALSLSGCASAPEDSDALSAIKPADRLPIAQTERGVMIWLPSQVMFETGKSSFNEADAAPYLDKVARLLRDKTQKTVFLEGHTDNVGTPDYNQDLSERRAASVRSAMLSRGVPAERLQAKGFGLTQPIAPNDSDIGRSINRRVEVIVLDEAVENITRDEPANSFEAAFDILKRLFGDAAPATAK
jgi:outer membrane protein OmpA-like peptidoglycan-associated protein